MTESTIFVVSKSYVLLFADMFVTRNFNRPQKLNGSKVLTSLAFELSDVVFIMRINVKMQPIIGILTVFDVQLILF